LTPGDPISKQRRARWIGVRAATAADESRPARTRRNELGSVIKKRRKKMRKHKQRKLLKRQRHKK
jgi:hypothetical protein